MKTPLPFFAEQFSEIVGKARSYGVGETMAQIARRNPGVVGLSTLKAAEAGRHVRPSMLRTIARVYEMQPLDWIETKICYMEAFIQAYLTPIAERRGRDRIEPAALEHFLRCRSQRLAELPPGKIVSCCRDRLAAYVQGALDQAKKQPRELCAPSGTSASKKDRLVVKYPTVTALLRGEHIRPEKLNAICCQIGLSPTEQGIMRILYAEAYLGEHLLNADPKVYRRLREADHPRTVSMLIFSTENARELA